jgi:hypothetical protein
MRKGERGKGRSSLLTGFACEAAGMSNEQGAMRNERRKREPAVRAEGG